MQPAFATLALIAVTVFTSYKGFTDATFRNRYRFDVGAVRTGKEYHRLFSSGFLHVSWWHLIFNMIALWAFGDMLEAIAGPFRFLFIYIAGLAGGNVLALFLHKNQSDYTSVGASGAVNAIVYAAIALFPNMGIGFFLLPLSIPAWAFGLAYVLFSIYGLKNKWGNTGHAAHLGGALTGLLLAIAFYPEALAENYLPILAIAVPTIGFLAYVIYKPEALVIGSSKRVNQQTIDNRYNYQKAQEQTSLDDLLEKIHKNGMSSLSKKERETLERLSKTKR